MQNEQNRTDEALPAAGPPAAVSTLRQRRLPMLAAAALLVLAGIGTAYVILREPANGNAHELPGDGPSSHGDPLRKPILFAGWGQPDRVLVVSGQMHGYMFPCGCSEPQYGGLVRRQVFIDSLKAKGWDVVGVDLGELPPLPGTSIPRQRELKLQYTMKALDLMGYRAVGLGKTEMEMPLVNALSQYSINKATPRPINATLADTWQKGTFLHSDGNARPFEILPGSPRVGVVSFVGPDLEDAITLHKMGLKFVNNKNVLPKLFKEFADQKVDMAMLLHHEYAKDPANGELAGPLKMDRMRRDMAEGGARIWEAERQQAFKKNGTLIPPLQLLMVLTEEPEPPAVLQTVPGTPTQVLEIGHKGKYVGVVGIFRTPTGLQLKYELVRMEPSLEPAPGQKNKVRDVLEEYAKQVKDEDLLMQFIRSPHPIQVDPYVLKKYGGSTYIGTARCVKCHKAEGQIWQATLHPIAFKTLQRAMNPALRQFDPECVVCHTVGFRHAEGYNDLTRSDMQDLLQKKAGADQIQAALAARNSKFEHVGCENCHGPGSAHANGNPDDAKLYPLINPFRPSEKEDNLAKLMNAAPNPAVRKQAAQEAKSLFTKRMERLDDFCQKCHDLENDVHWAQVPFLDKWVGGGIVHNGPNNVGNQWLPPRKPAVAPNGGSKN
jgi:hypothetical protein